MAIETSPLHRLRAILLARFEAVPVNLRGAAWVTLSATSFTMMAGVIKHLGSNLDSFEISFFRCVFALIVTLPFALREGPAALRTKRPLVHIGRAAVGMLAMFSGYYGITKLPLADATTIGFTRALFMIPLAVVFLGERVQAARWIATILGFVGVIVMMRPGGEGPLWASFVALAGALFTAAGIVFVKKLAATEHPATILVFYNFATTLMSFPTILPHWVTPDLRQLMLLAIVAGLAGVGQFCTIRGYAIAEASAVVPFGYARLVFAGLIGFLFWGEVPDAWSLAGATIVLGSTLFIALREARRRRLVIAPAERA